MKMKFSEFIKKHKNLLAYICFASIITTILLNFPSLFNDAGSKAIVRKIFTITYFSIFIIIVDICYPKVEEKIIIFSNAFALFLSFLFFSLLSYVTVWKSKTNNILMYSFGIFCIFLTILLGTRFLVLSSKKMYVILKLISTHFIKNDEDTETIFEKVVKGITTTVEVITSFLLACYALIGAIKSFLS